jgi:6-pyruvoyltetrahydropterin/6-carboxytetrahydropterin synthase
MGTVYVYRRAHFSASHRLFDPQYSDEKNIEIFGKCAHPNGHGHNYYLEVCVAGIPNPMTGYVIDLKQLKTILDEKFLHFVDHKNLNVDVPFLKNINPTTENLAIACWNQIHDEIHEGQLYSVRVYETENNFVEYRGGK